MRIINVSFQVNFRKFPWVLLVLVSVQLLSMPSVLYEYYSSDLIFFLVRSSMDFLLLFLRQTHEEVNIKTTKWMNDTNVKFRMYTK